MCKKCSADETVVATETGTLLSPPVNVAPQYDADGNLEQDGLWEYAWDAKLVQKAKQSLLDKREYFLFFIII